MSLSQVNMNYIKKEMKYFYFHDTEYNTQNLPHVLILVTFDKQQSSLLCTHVTDMGEEILAFIHTYTVNCQCTVLYDSTWFFRLCFNS